MFHGRRALCALGLALSSAGLMTIIGCTEKAKTETKDEKPKTDAEKKAAEAKDTFLKPLAAEVAKFDEKLTALKADAAKETGDKKGAAEAKVKEFEAKKAAYEKAVADAKAAAPEKWDAVKADVSKAFDDWKKAAQ